MRSQEERDQRTVAIARAVLVVGLVLGLGVGLGAVVPLLLDLFRALG